MMTHDDAYAQSTAQRWAADAAMHVRYSQQFEVPAVWDSLFATGEHGSIDAAVEMALGLHSRP